MTRHPPSPLSLASPRPPGRKAACRTSARPPDLRIPIPHVGPLLAVLVLVLSLALPALALAPRATRPLSDADIRALADAVPEWESVHSGHLGRMLIPRPADYSTVVRNYISDTMTALGWHEERTPFTAHTPIGDIDFVNLVYTFDPGAQRRLVLAAHYDSKWFPDFPANQFIGATDSAAPCAFLLDLAEALTPPLAARAARLAALDPILVDGFDEEDAGETTVQLVFFDGEEAFHDWTRADSVYGARHLADLWSTTYVAHPRRRLAPLPTVLETIDTLVLLDLLGAADPRIHSFYRATDWLFDLLAGADRKLRAAGLVDGTDDWWQSKQMAGGIDDDHRPFVEKGVSILHVIAYPFPRVWHTLGDDASALDLATLRRWNRILRVFVAEYLCLAPSDGGIAPVGRVVDELTRSP
ncbi:hypothetical protein Q5752_005639 [Cryptotrichosporon argae]